MSEVRFPVSCPLPLFPSHAQATEQCVHVGPQAISLLTFLVRQSGESVFGVNAGQVRIAPRILQALPDPGVGLRIAVVEPLATPGEVLAEPVQGLPAQEGTFLVGQLVRVPTLTAPADAAAAGGMIAVCRQHVFGQLGLRNKSLGVKSG